MTVPLSEAMDEAKFVKFYQHTYVGVWHGSHTINYYEVVYDSDELRPMDTQSVGDYETGETTLEEVKEAIETTFENWE